jgi:hypothetical protein
VDARGTVVRRSPSIRRVTSRLDQRGALPDFGQSYSAYSYVLNSPLNLLDPTGLQQQPP